MGWASNWPCLIEWQMTKRRGSRNIPDVHLSALAPVPAQQTHFQQGKILVTFSSSPQASLWVSVFTGSACKVFAPAKVFNKKLLLRLVSMHSPYDRFRTVHIRHILIYALHESQLGRPQHRTSCTAGVFSAFQVEPTGPVLNWSTEVFPKSGSTLRRDANEAHRR